MKEPAVLALGHRFASLAIEEAALEGVARVVDANELTLPELNEQLSRAAAVMLGTRASIDAGTMAAMDNCRIIVRYGVGVDNIDVAEASRRGIAVANVPDYCMEEVSDHALALLLAANRRLLQAAAAGRAGEWGTGVMRGAERLATQTVGLVAFGRIAQALARKARPLAGRIVAFDPLVGAEEMAALGVESVSFQTLLEQSDYVSIHCPLNDHTRHLFDGEALATMKPTAWLINTARGEIIDESALLDALQQGQIGGAALDVLSQEPPPEDHPLLDLPNVILTPHVAYYSRQAIEDLQRHAAEQVRQYLQGERPDWLLNGAALTENAGGAR